MPRKIGPIFGGRIPRGSLRLGRSTPLALETLKTRVLLSGGVLSSTVGQASLPAVIATLKTVAPVALQFPASDSTLTGIASSTGGKGPLGIPSSGGETELYQVSPEADTEIFQLTLSWAYLPAGISVQLFVFDNTGSLLGSTTQDNASESTTINLGARGLDPRRRVLLGHSDQWPDRGRGGSFPFLLTFETLSAPLEPQNSDGSGDQIPPDSPAITYGTTPSGGEFGSVVVTSVNGTIVVLGLNDLGLFIYHAGSVTFGTPHRVPTAARRQSAGTGLGGSPSPGETRLISGRSDSAFRISRRAYPRLRFELGGHGGEPDLLRMGRYTGHLEL